MTIEHVTGHLTDGGKQSSPSSSTSQPCDSVPRPSCHQRQQEHEKPQERSRETAQKQADEKQGLAHLISSNPCLQLIASHLFHRGFTGDFLSSLMQRLRKEERVTAVSPVHALLTGDKNLLQVTLFPSLTQPVTRLAPLT